MSEGKYLIYEGVIVKNLEQIWSNLWNQYVDIDENDDYEADDEAMKHDEVHGKTLRSSKSVGTEYLLSSIPNEHF